MSAGGVYDCIVVGAGVEGSATAYFLALNGQNTLLLEQFPLPHTRGSSHGATRIIRKIYDVEIYTQMMQEAFPMWQEIERESKTELYRRCGLLFLGVKGSKRFETSASNIAKHGNSNQRLTRDDIIKKYHPLVTFPSDIEAVFDPDGGILMADKALLALQIQFVKSGGSLHDAEAVTKILPGDLVMVTTTKNTYQARNIVLTPGPWARKMLAPLGIHIPLKPIKIAVYYWKVKQPDHYSVESFPVFTYFESSRKHFFGLPATEYPGMMKVCLHDGPEIDPDLRDEADPFWSLNKTIQFVKSCFPQLKPTPSIVESCIYTNTPDENLVLDTHPVWKNIIIGAGFSGHGFKLAPVVGKILGEMAMKRSPSYNLEWFCMDRFHPKASL